MLHVVYMPEIDQLHTHMCCVFTWVPCRPVKYLARTDCGMMRASAETVLGIEVGLAFSKAPNADPPINPKTIDTNTLKAG